MKDKALIKFAREFRKGILGNVRETMMRASQATTNADQHRKVMDSLYETFGYRPDEDGGEQWTVYQNHSLIVVHPERRPRIYKRGCGGLYYEI